MKSSSTAAPAEHRVGDTFRVKGLELTDHFFKVPLNHFAAAAADAANAETIEVFAREVVSMDKSDPAKRKDMPYLLFLQGGPGFEAARPTEIGGWLGAATESFRVLLLDQRGTVRRQFPTAATLRCILPSFYFILFFRHSLLFLTSHPNVSPHHAYCMLLR